MGWEWRPYVSVAARREQARKETEQLKKKGMNIEPVEIEGRKIAKTFWGLGWCNHLESFSDFSNRLPRGRTYVRNGSVCHLEIKKGQINAMVSGSEIYNIEISISKLPGNKWEAVKKKSAGQIGSLLELLQGGLSKNLMSIVTDRQKGIFPLPKEIKLECDCPDYAVMCKHVAAALYGVGARLDVKPELLFLLRGVDHLDLISGDVEAVTKATSKGRSGRRRLTTDNLNDVFGIEIADEVAVDMPSKSEMPKKSPTRSSKKKKKKQIQSNSKNSIRTGKPSTPLPANTVRPRKIKTISKSKSSPLPKPTKMAPLSITGTKVRKLRSSFAMTKKQFGEIIGVSGATIGNWEKKEELSLRAKALSSFSKVEKLTKRRAWNRLSR